MCSIMCMHTRYITHECANMIYNTAGFLGMESASAHRVLSHELDKFSHQLVNQEDWLPQSAHLCFDGCHLW